jgi:tRNA uridine 5-carboxymethylaminomethyl modification enzyme
MFTSRAEYRLLLRQDNADERLMPLGAELGCVDEGLYQARRDMWSKRDELLAELRQTSIAPEDWHADAGGELRRRTKASDLLKRPGVGIRDVVEAGGLSVAPREVLVRAEADVKYEGFVAKQRDQIERLRRMEQTEIPQDMDYESIPGLLNESRAKLSAARPVTLGQASRISGVTPADISILMMHIPQANS